MNEIGDQEKIDIVTYDENPEQFIRNALSPAEVVKVEINEQTSTRKYSLPKTSNLLLSVVVARTFDWLHV